MVIKHEEQHGGTQALNADSKNEESTTIVKETATAEEQQIVVDHKTKIYNLIILDESGSMRSIMHAAIDGFNETVNGIRSAQQKFAATQEHYVSLLTFCSCRQKMIYHNVPVNEVSELTEHEYSPCCRTPLYDAMGVAITQLYEQIKDMEDATVVVTIITDGLENASHEYSGKDIKSLVDKFTNEEGWTFAYMGTNQNVKEVAQGLSIGNYMFFHDNEEDMKRAWRQDKNAKMRHYDALNTWHVCCCSMSASDKKMYRAEHNRSEKFFMTQEDIRLRITPAHLQGVHEDEVLVYTFTRLFYKIAPSVSALLEKYSGDMVGARGRHKHCYCLRMSLHDFERNQSVVDRFLEHVVAHPEKKFMLTRIGMEHFENEEQVANWFVLAAKYPNVYLPVEYWQYII